MTGTLTLVLVLIDLVLIGSIAGKGGLHGVRKVLRPALACLVFVELQLFVASALDLIPSPLGAAIGAGLALLFLVVIFVAE